MSTDSRWFHRRGTLARDGWECVVDELIPGWQHTGLRVAALDPGDELVLPAGVESFVVPLAGSFTVEHGVPGRSTVLTELHGRSSVFDGPTDLLYVSSAERASVRGRGSVAVATSPTREVMPTRYLPAEDVPVEVRGGGVASRQVHNFGTPGTLAAARLIVCEVVTPAGNWSSYPPHKHDEDVPGRESRLEEIYYFEVSPGRGDISSAFGLFHAYGSPTGDLEINARVHTGDVALIPHGYHGPAVASPGHDLYYLNVMAGPGAREWLITDDPAHAWIRDTWPTSGPDPRLPMPVHIENSKERL